MNSVYVTNPMLKPMIPMLTQEWNVVKSWEDAYNAEEISALATTVWETIDETYLSQFPHLKIICHLGIGIDNIDLDYLTRHQITLKSQPQAGIHDTSELALTLMLSLARQIIPNHQYTQNNLWAEKKPRHLGNHLRYKQLGLVGLGQIGTRIAHFASAFEMEIAYTARTPRNTPYTYCADINKLAQISDFLIVCCSGGAQTQQLINHNVLQNLGPKGYLINVSRGSVVDQDALIDALEQGKIAGAGLDVYTHEPQVPERLRQLDNVVLSPHMGSSTHENLHLMYQLQAEQLNEYLNEFALND